MLHSRRDHLGLALCALWAAACSPQDPATTDDSETDPNGLIEVHATIGPDGGSVGGALATAPVLEVPAGALATETTITIVEEDGADPEDGVRSRLWRFEPAGLRFAVPATVHIPFTPGEGDEVVRWTASLDAPAASLETTLVGAVAAAGIEHFSVGWVGGPRADTDVPGDTDVLGDTDAGTDTDVAPDTDVASDTDTAVVTDTDTGAPRDTDPPSDTAPLQNHAPSVSGVLLSPNPAGEAQDLHATARAVDVDGDALTLTWTFYFNNTLYTSGASDTITGNLLFRGDTWRAELTVSDGTVTVGPFASNDVPIVDLPPTTPVAYVLPEVPQPCDDLVCHVGVPASYDPDPNDGVSFVRFEWSRNGVPWTGAMATTGITHDTIRSAQTAPGDVWTCSIITTSGPLDSAPGMASKTIDDGAVVDVFAMSPRSTADVLLVVGDDGSMLNQQADLANDIPTLVSDLNAAGVDYHIGVVTPDMSYYRLGAMLPASTGGVYVAPNTPGINVVLADMITIPSSSPSNLGLSATKAALTEPLLSGANAGFLRPSGPLAIFFFTDQGDNSVYFTPLVFATWLRTLRSDSDLILWADVALSASCPTSVGVQYLEATRYFRGGRSSICAASYVDALHQFAYAISGLPRQLTLSRVPKAGTLVVTHVAANGQRTTLVEGVDWTHKSNFGAVMLTAPQTAGTSVEVAYDVDCAAAVP